MESQPQTRKPDSPDVSDDGWAFVAPDLSLLSADAPQRQYPLHTGMGQRPGGNKRVGRYQLGEIFLT